MAEPTVRVDAAVVPVTPDKAQGIVADNADLQQIRVVGVNITRLVAMALAGGARTPAPQVREWIIAHVAIGPQNVHLALLNRAANLCRSLADLRRILEKIP